MMMVIVRESKEKTRKIEEIVIGWNFRIPKV